MSDIALAIIFLLLAVGGMVVRKTYYHLPARELKRRANKNDQFAVQLYRAVAYGNSLRGLLWLHIGLMTGLSVILLARELPVWVSLLIVGPFLWITFSLIPTTRVTKLGAGLTNLVTPLVAWLLYYLHPILNRGADVVEGRLTRPDHTKLYEREDLIELIERQQWQNDSRITDEELEIAKRALSFDDHKVADLLTPRKKIKSVLADDTIGPVLIDELHKSGQEYVFVRESKKGPVIGTLQFNKLSIDSEGKVKDLMNPTVYYIHENDSLSQVLHAFFVTNQPTFVVVNGFEEYVGIIGMENILRQLLGHIPGEEFDQYANMEAVAHRHSQPAKPDTSGETPEEVVE